MSYSLNSLKGLISVIEMGGKKKRVAPWELLYFFLVGSVLAVEPDPEPSEQGAPGPESLEHQQQDPCWFLVYATCALYEHYRDHGILHDAGAGERSVRGPNRGSQALRRVDLGAVLLRDHKCLASVPARYRPGARGNLM